MLLLKTNLKNLLPRQYKKLIYSQGDYKNIGYNNIPQQYLQLKRELDQKGNRLIGYLVPAFASPNHEQLIRYFSKNLIMNLGDPFNAKCNFTQSSSLLQKKVINFFGQLFNINNYWGYVTSGSTQSVLQGVFMGKQYLAKKYNKNPINLISDGAHYSHGKSALLTGLQTRIIPTDQFEQMNLEQLKKIISSIDQETPLLLTLTIGTTMMGGIDNYAKIIEILKQSGRSNYYIHADLALNGMLWRFSDEYPKIFSETIDSFNISGHKFFQISFACGIFICRQKHISTAWDNKEVSIIRTTDVTITGTRNGLPTILLYESIREGIQPIKKIVNECWQRTNYLKKLLEKKNIDYYCRPTSITVSFQQPSQLLCKKYQLATKGNKSHVICLPHVSEKILDQFVEQLSYDLKQLLKK